MRSVVALLLALASSGAFACGYCVEDKIASTYDHAVITRALGQKHHVAFFHLDGPVTPGEAAKRSVESMVESTPGVDKGSVRVALETLTVSFAFDPARSPLMAVQAAMDKKLAAKKLSLMPLRLIDSPAELKLVKR
jgi:hypothetical protein